jgi:hypothetical protein
MTYKQERNLGLALWLGSMGILWLCGLQFLDAVIFGGLVGSAYFMGFAIYYSRKASAILRSIKERQ